MKRIKLAVLAIFLPILMVAQGGIEIVPFAGYMFGGSVKFYEGELKISNGVDYGLSIFIPVKSILEIEVNYTGMNSQAEFRAYPAYPEFSDEKTTISTNYFHVGVIKAFETDNPSIEPFGSLSLGATMFSLTDYTDTWRFSIAAGIGVKFMFGAHVGIMLRGRLLMPMGFAGSGGYCGLGTDGGNTCLNISGLIQPIQGDFNAGLIIKIGN